VRRMRELIRAASQAHPHDDFFGGVDARLKICSQARAFYRAYDRALSYLDQQSWAVLSSKALAHFRDHRKGQLKQGFFNQLNDAFAYRFLVRRGYSRVSILREGNKTTPDIKFFDGDTCHYCEVKTIGISEEEINRRVPNSYIDRSVYRELSPEFLKKLGSTLDLAHSQVSSQDATGLVFVVAQFDDFTMAYYDRYRAQLEDFLQKHEVPDIYVKVGIIGRNRIWKGLLAHAGKDT
jgi:hypothetical protein